MQMTAGQTKGGMKCVELGKGKLALYYPEAVQRITIPGKPYWYFQGECKKVNNCTVFLMGTGDIDNDFKALSKQREFVYGWDHIWSFDVYYVYGNEKVKLQVY